MLEFRKHIKTVSNKVEKIVSELAWLMPNVGGPMVEKRKLLTSVVHFQLLYASSIRTEPLTYECNKKKLASSQRKMAIRVASAYHTVSYKR